MSTDPEDVCFSNRPFEVKRFQTIHPCNVDIAHGLALLFGIGTRALPLWDSRTFDPEPLRAPKLIEPFISNEQCAARQKPPSHLQ
jgi:hypothetical protein